MDQIDSGAPVFDLSGGQLALDFANTVEDRPAAQPDDRLRRYGDLVAWARQAGLLTDDRARALLRRGAARPAEAMAVLPRAVALREAIYRIFLAVGGGGEPAPADLAALNGALADALARARLVPAEGGAGFAWGWADDDALDRMLWPVVRAAADLLVGEDLARTRVCSAHDCNWLFVDTSRNASRRWCNMQVCGNRAKARRFQQRKRGRKD